MCRFVGCQRRSVGELHLNIEVLLTCKISAAAVVLLTSKICHKRSVGELHLNVEALVIFHLDYRESSDTLNKVALNYEECLYACSGVDAAAGV